MFAIRGLALKAGVAIAALCFVAPSANAAKLFLGKSAPVSTPKIGSIGSFTPAAADARRLSAFGQIGFGGTGFRFTPSAAPGGNRKVTVAIRARSTGARIPADSTTLIGQSTPLAPSAYNLGMSLGWKRFALSGDIARFDGGLITNKHESADVGVSYGGRNWSTRLLVGADRNTDQRNLLGPEDSYSVDLAGAYALTHGVEVTGGVRYKLQHDRLDQQNDVRRDSQAVYIGTAFKF